MLLLEPSHSSCKIDLQQLETRHSVVADATLGLSRYMILKIGTGLHRLWLTNTSATGGHAFKVIADDALGVRIEALWTFERVMSGSGNATSQGMIPTPFQRSRLDLMLRILDFQRERIKPTMRQLAREVTYPHSAFSSAAEWKASSERRRTQRLALEANALASLRYRSLLKGQP